MVHVGRQLHSFVDLKGRGSKSAWHFPQTAVVWKTWL